MRQGCHSNCMSLASKHTIQFHLYYVDECDWCILVSPTAPNKTDFSRPYTDVRSKRLSEQSDCVNVRMYARRYEAKMCSEERTSYESNRNVMYSIWIKCYSFYCVFPFLASPSASFMWRVRSENDWKSQQRQQQQNVLIVFACPRNIHLRNNDRKLCTENILDGKTYASSHFHLRRVHSLRRFWLLRRGFWFSARRQTDTHRNETKRFLLCS